MQPTGKDCRHTKSSYTSDLRRESYCKWYEYSQNSGYNEGQEKRNTKLEQDHSEQNHRYRDSTEESCKRESIPHSLHDTPVTQLTNVYIKKKPDIWITTHLTSRES